MSKLHFQYFDYVYDFQHEVEYKYDFEEGLHHIIYTLGTIENKFKKEVIADETEITKILATQLFKERVAAILGYLK